MEPKLFCLTRPPRTAPPPRAGVALLLPIEDCEPRLIMRLVCRLPTGTGEVVCDRRAAAAAAEESDVVEAEFLRKAEVAAMAALELGATLTC